MKRIFLFGITNLLMLTGFAIVRMTAGYGLIDTEGRTVLNFEWDQIRAGDPVLQRTITPGMFKQ